MTYIAGFITDTHLSKHNIQLNLDIFQQAINICKKKHIPLYHGGDFLEERKKTQDFDTKEGFEWVLQLFNDNGIILNGICGNHDKLNYTEEKNWLSQFSTHPNFNLTQSNSFEDIGNVRIHLLSYFLETDNYIDYLHKCKKNIDKTKTNVLLTHVSVTGAQNNDGTKVDNGLSLSDFKDFDLVLSGHYHESQTIKNFVYFGSAYQANYGETNEKGITLLKEDGTLEFVKLNFPEYIKIKIDIDKIDNKELARLTKEHSNSDNNVCFEFLGNENKLKSIKKDLFTSNGIEVRTKIREIQTSMELTETDEVISFNKANIEEEFELFCEENELNLEDGKPYLQKILKNG